MIRFDLSFWSRLISVRRSVILATLILVLGTISFFEVHGAMLVVEEKPDFILPFTDPPGPNSWYFLQPYGNTTFAYRFRTTTYGSGQGLHFGVDLAAPCGTPILAIGDGSVYSVDSWHGAGPHNLMINHENGYASFYGHLLVRSPLKRGEKVKQGQVVGQVGDPDLTCSSRPHLHLEIRSEDHRVAYNPLTLIEAEWEQLALVGGFPQSFEQEMDTPRRWQGLLDQPEVRFGYPLLNAYESAFPPDW